MWDLAFLTAVVTFLLVLPLIRPFFKGLWAINGLVLLPLTAFLILFGLFRTYGFRPECFPLLIFAALLTLLHIPSAFALINRLQNDDFRDRNNIVSVLGILVLLAASVCAFYFSPYDDIKEAGTSYSYEAELRESSEKTNRAITRHLRVYTAGDRGTVKPVIALIPPLTGSVEISESLCRRLSEAGHTVVTFSRRGLDNPASGKGKEFHLSIYESMRLLWISTRAQDSGWANQLARTYEEKRRADAEWLLDRLRTPELLRLTRNAPHIIAAGYGAGGAALSLLASSPSFAVKYPELLGFVSIEGPPASARKLESFPWETASEPQGAWDTLKRFFLKLKPRKLMGQELPDPILIPGLFITASQIHDEKYRDSRYGVIRDMVRQAKAPCSLSSVAGAGFLDYSDVKRRYPLYHWLLLRTQPGQAAPEDP
ncbi:MAG: hypothetical protein LBH73_08875, partial [Spirochaetaceae bacterium]|nr:hypothetical protein [Spirochaetaceae bacterium]